MKLEDYIIDQTGKDWAELLSVWADLIPPIFTVFLVNRFGDVFMIFEDHSVHLLDVGGGTVKRIAADRDDLANKIDLEDNANDWLMIPLVDQCAAAGMTLSPDQCYGFKIPPLLGGQYTLDNVFVISLREHYAVHADLYQQSKDLPDGARVTLEVIEVPKSQTPERK